MAQKKLTKKTLMKSFHHWYYGNLTCFSQEHMQTFGYLTSMLPIVEELYDNKEDQARSMQTYTAFFNTEPQLGSLIVGITAGLEEARANGSEEVDDETINGLRAGLMGPVAGIGDSLVVGTLIPVILGIALGLSTGGSPIGAVFYIVIWNLLAYLGMRLPILKVMNSVIKLLNFSSVLKVKPFVKPFLSLVVWLSVVLLPLGYLSKHHSNLVVLKIRTWFFKIN